MEWTENLKQHVRSLIMELSLHSGAEYQIFILCHVKDNKISIDLPDAEALESLKAHFVPREFLDLTILFNDQTLESWYPKLIEHQCVTSKPYPLQALTSAQYETPILAARPDTFPGVS
jgi:hypothetical protein